MKAQWAERILPCPSPRFLAMRQFLHGFIRFLNNEPRRHVPRRKQGAVFAAFSVFGKGRLGKGEKEKQERMFPYA